MTPTLNVTTPMPRTWIVEKSGGSGGGPTDIPPAPPVTNLTATVTARSNMTWEVNVDYTKAGTANATNYTGVAVYLEDPDISNKPVAKLDGTTPLDGSRNLAGKWNPTKVTDSTASPATVLVPGQTRDRYIRIYLASYGPNTTPKLVRANEPGATPNIQVLIPAWNDSYVSGEEYARLITLPVANQTDYFDKVAPDGTTPPSYTLFLSYLPPDPALPLLSGLAEFGGVQITYMYLKADGTEAARADGPFI